MKQSLCVSFLPGYFKAQECCYQRLRERRTLGVGSFTAQIRRLRCEHYQLQCGDCRMQQGFRTVAAIPRISVGDLHQKSRGRRHHIQCVHHCMRFGESMVLGLADAFGDVGSQASSQCGHLQCWHQCMCGGGMGMVA